MPRETPRDIQQQMMEKFLSSLGNVDFKKIAIEFNTGHSTPREFVIRYARRNKVPIPYINEHSNNIDYMELRNRIKLLYRSRGCL